MRMSYTLLKSNFERKQQVSLMIKKYVDLVQFNGGAWCFKFCKKSLLSGNPSTPILCGYSDILGRTYTDAHHSHSSISAMKICNSMNFHSLSFVDVTCSIRKNNSKKWTRWRRRRRRKTVIKLQKCKHGKKSFRKKPTVSTSSPNSLSASSQFDSWVDRVVCLCLWKIGNNPKH